MSTDPFLTDTDPLRLALAKIRTRSDELTQKEHEHLTAALMPFLSQFATLLQSLEAAAEGSVEAIDWDGLVLAIREDELVGDVVPLSPFITVTEEEVAAWTLRGAAQMLKDRQLHAGLVQKLMNTADEIAPIEVLS